MLLNHLVSIYFLFFLGFYTFPHQCFLSLIHQLLNYPTSSCIFTLVIFYGSFLRIYSHISAFINFLKSFNQAYRQLFYIKARLWIIDSETTWKNYSLILFPYLHRFNILHKHKVLSVVCMEGRNNSRGG